MLELGKCGTLGDLSLGGSFEKVLYNFLIDTKVSLHVFDLLHRLVRLLAIESDLRLQLRNHSLVLFLTLLRYLVGCNCLIMIIDVCQYGVHTLVLMGGGIKHVGGSTAHIGDGK